MVGGCQNLDNRQWPRTEKVGDFAVRLVYPTEIKKIFVIKKRMSLGPSSSAIHVKGTSTTDSAHNLP